MKTKFSFSSDLAGFSVSCSTFNFLSLASLRFSIIIFDNLLVLEVAEPALGEAQRCRLRRVALVVERVDAEFADYYSIRFHTC